MRRVALVATALVLAGCGDGPAAPAELLPDLDQLAPQAVSVVKKDRRWHLVFGSAVENIGRGALLIEGTRPSTGVATMTTRQGVRRADGTTITYPLRVRLRYVRSEDHAHWHVLRFDRYTLHAADRGTFAARDRKTGFCLGDRYKVPLKRLPGTPPSAVLSEECAKGQPDALRVREGISVGYGDPYHPNLEGQFLDITSVPPGRYVLVHRVNADRSLRESDYGNNAASALIRA